nr:ribosomal protein S6 kinase delta-1-like [Lytechinus pictus]
MASSKKKETWIRSFNVTEPTKHEKGFTVYKVTYRAFRLDKAEEVIEVAVWKRYNDFKKLHQALSLLHYHLRRPEKFPDFAKARFFGRFDEKTIEERRQSALRLLEFTVKVPPLAKSTHFVEFFKGGETVTRRKVSSENPILKPQVANPESDNGSFPNKPLSSRALAASIPRMEGEGEENQAETSQTQSLPTSGNELGGVWLHRQQEDEEQKGEDSEGGGEGYDDSEDERTTFSEDSMPSTPLPQLEELTFFDPLSPSEPGSTEPGTLPHSNSWLFHAMDICAELNRDFPEPTSNSHDDPTPAGSIVTSDSTDSGITVTVPPSLQSYSSDSAISSVSSSGGMTANRNSHNSLARAYLNSLRAQQAAEEDANSTGITDSRSVATGERSRHVSDDSISKWNVSGEDDYLYQAAGKISLALDNQSVGNYQASFDAYKAGVAILLNGVVADKSKTRREAVRRKTAQYLMKAEDIYNKYLSVEASNARRWESEKMAMEVDASSAYLRGNIDELKSYKVLGCIDSVLLVLDMSTYQTFIIKSLSKCSVPNTKMITRVPAFCPYMVRLYRYFETESSIFLLLEHATGGKLWNYASPYLKQQKEATGRQELANSLKSSTLSRQSQRSRSGSTRSGRGLKDDVFSPAEAVEEATTQVEDTSDTSHDPDAHADAASVGSIEGKLIPSPAVSGSYVNLLDACGEYVTGGEHLGDGETIPHKRLSDSNLNDLVSQSSNYDECADNARTEQDDSLFLSDTNEETEMFSHCEVFGSTPCKVVLPDAKESMSSAPPASMALFSIDSIESPNEYSMGEIGDSSVFGFESSTSGPPIDAVPVEAGSVDLEVKSETEKLDLDPARVIAEALAVVQEVEQMRKEEEEAGIDHSVSNQVLEQENVVDFLENSNIIQEIVTDKESSSEMPNADASESSQAFLDTRAFGVFSEEEMVPGVDLADFFDSGSPKKRSQSLSEKPSRHDPKDSFSNNSHSRPPFMQQSSMMEFRMNEPLGKHSLIRDTTRTVSMGADTRSQEENVWDSFFDGGTPDTKGFGFDTSTGPKVVESRSSVTGFQESAEHVAPNILNLPDVPKDIPRDSEDEDNGFGGVFDVKDDHNVADSGDADIYMLGDNRLDLSSGDRAEADALAQPRQNPDGASSEEIEKEMQNAKTEGNASNVNQKDMNLHINPFDNDKQLIITSRKDSNSSTAYVSVDPSDANLPSIGVMRDFPSSSTVSAQSTPQHTFQPINSNQEIAPPYHKVVIAPVVPSSIPAVSTDSSNVLCHSGEAVEDNIYGKENGLVGEANTTPTNSRTSTLKGETLHNKDTSLPSLSRLFSHLDDMRRSRAESSSATLPESCVRIWASEILVALATLHAAGITCRDLNPDNILLAEGGHVRLTYFSQWKWVCQEMNPKAQINMFTAPEATGIFGVGPACDWWSYGVILFELLTGQSLYSCHPSGINSHTQLFIPDHISPEAKNLLTQLLQVNPLERLGGGQSGADEVKVHPFFKEVNWSSLLG